MDIAKLGFVVDTSDVKRAERDVESLGSAAERTEDKVDNAARGIRGASSRIQQAMSNAAGRSGAAWQKFRDSMAGAGGLSAVISTGALSLAAGRAIEAAKNAQEAASMFDEVFKDQADSTRKWSQELATTIGRSAYELQGQAAQFQQVLTGMFPDRAQAAEMSRTFAALAQDVASFYNLSESDAVAKLRSGLTGEMEPLKQLGLVISATAVEAKALEMGLAGSAKALTDQDKAAARAQLIIDGLADAQGDAERTAGGLANQQRALSSAVNDLYITMGTYLLPVATKIVGWLRDMVGAFNSLSPETQRYIAYTAALAAAIGPLLTALGLMALAIPPITAAIGLLLSPIGAAAAAFTALTAAGVSLYQNWDELSARFPVLKAGADAVRTAFGLWQQTMGAVVDAVRPLVAYVSDNMASAFRTIAALLRGDFIGAFQEMRTQVESNMTAIATQALPWAANIVAAIAQGLAGLPAVAVEAIRKLAAAMAAGMASIAQSAASWGRDIVQGMVDGITRTEDRIEGAVGSLANRIKNRFTGDMAIQSPSRVFMRFGQFITEGLGIGIDQGAQGAEGAMSRVAGGITGVAEDMRSGLSSILKTAITDFENLGDAVGSVLDGIASKILDSGISSLVGGLFGGGVVGNDALSSALRGAIPSFAGGGYTWDGPRTGGMDGRGGRLAMLHPRETVVDHTRRGQSAGMTYSPTFNIGGSVTAEDLAAVRREASAGYMQMERSMPGRVNSINRDPLRR